VHLFILIGPSAVGKTTIMEALLADPELQLVRFPTTTSREPREGEVNGVHYQFLSDEAFRHAITAGTFFEWVEIYGHLYGTNKETLQELRKNARPIICVLELEGAKKIKQAAPDQTTIILIEAPREILITRLQTRHMDPEDFAKRVERIDRELVLYPALADVRIQNTEGELEETITAVKKVIQGKSYAQPE
jgi:guanylate kinase